MVCYARHGRRKYLRRRPVSGGLKRLKISAKGGAKEKTSYFICTGGAGFLRFINVYAKA
ncbi:hypothetical protein CAMSH0001_2391 [Campylobacter showae RM3277]|uniref:Uncharacterized protein n=1 Tax=Campylobacter showae RM3277 TaxID=553219 RepID=C6RCL7_9BACT|nr:hypothetical protein CAMSH0001_2391 [Campylobacter showae RM3277]